MTNVAPTGLNDVIGVKANTQHKFVAADFGFNDLDGNRLKEVIISTLPAGGSLLLGGVAVTANQHISAAQIGSLVWSAPTGFIGQHPFTFQVVDDSGVAGSDTDLTANTLTLNVAAPLSTPANIDLSTLNGTNGFAITGVAIGDYSGSSVSNAGDVNGDGFDDVIIGAIKADANAANSGAAYIVFGKASGFADLNLSSLDGVNGFKISGVTANYFFGQSVSSAGDVNGDGFSDVIIGARGADPHGMDSGASYVLFGKASGFAANIDVTSLNGSIGFKINGAFAGDKSGYSVSSAGDVNGDGFDDLIIGAPYADPNGNSTGGASYVVFGKASGFGANVELSLLIGSDGFTISGNLVGDNSGYSVSSAGDVNGDGFADLLIGAPWADLNGNSSGASYVLFGKASGFATNINLSTLDGTNGFNINGENNFDSSGMELSSAGDINGDGFDDVLIGARNADAKGKNSGASYVLFGKGSAFAANIALSSLDGSSGFKIAGETAYDYSGISVSSAGDFNGDGFADLLIGANQAGPNAANCGASYVLFGKAAGFTATIALSSLDGSNGFRIAGVANNDYSGRSVSSAGDVNGDGFDDLVIGAYASDPNGNKYSGTSYILFGHATNFAPILPVAGLPSAQEDISTYTITDAQLLIGYHDPDGDTLVVTGLNADHGSFTHANGIWTYVPQKDYVGTVLLGYTISDGNSTPIAAASSFFLTDITDIFIGTRKADKLVGTLGHDEFKSSRGNDTLTSNGLPDTFFFSKNAGRDKILGFDAVGDDHDLINLQGLKSYIKSFADLSDNHMVQQRKDVIIDDGHGDVITLKGVHLADLDAADFMF